MARPLLDNLELQQVQEIETEQDQVLVQHGIPALEGDFLQRLDRRATQVTLIGVLTGAEVGERLKSLREKFRAAQPIPFVADITTATKVDQVLIEEMGVRELAGKPARFEYSFTLREYITPPAEETEEPPPEDEEETDPEVATLEVEVEVRGEPDFDVSTATVTVSGRQTDGRNLSRTLENPENNVWTERDFPPGQYTARAVVPEPSMAGTVEAVVHAGQTTRVKITLQRDQLTNIAKAFVVHFWFDRAFIEPCMRHVLRQVAEYASTHTDEKLLIAGHTDKVGPDAYNLSLGERRARSVYAYLTFGRDSTARAAALAEWNALRVQRPTGELPSIKDSWGAREYQYILQDIGFYSGSITEVHDGPTDSAVRAFQTEKGLAVDGIVGNDTWAALIDTYLSQEPLSISESQFLPNANDNCDGGILKWLGCGEQDPIKNTEDAWRPNRRTELMFVNAARLPCPVPQPDTFNLPSPGAVGTTWCLGPGDPANRQCFVTRDAVRPDRWLIQPAESGTVNVQGSVKFEDGTPASNLKYVLIAPDGEFLHRNGSGAADLGEIPSGDQRGRPVTQRNRTDLNGEFSYPAITFAGHPTAVGHYTMEIHEPLVARLAEDPPGAEKGNVVCKRLDGSSNFDVIVSSPGAHPAALDFVDADNVEIRLTQTQRGTSMRLRADLSDVTGDEVTVTVSGARVIGSQNLQPSPLPQPEFVDAVNVNNVITSVRVNDTIRVRADLPGIVGDEVTIQISSSPTH
jgi:outer membrane protein OmpA-like peptidoglycan-associated protein